MSNKTVVTIAREFGSGGHEVGKRLASELGINFYDHDFISMAVKKTGYHEEYVKRNEEKAPDFAGAALFSGMEFYQPSPFDRLQVEEHNIIRDIAKKESCVIVGRAADYVLEDIVNARVFLFAPIDDRIKRKMALLDTEQFKNINAAQMEKIIKHTDKQRRRYYEYYTDKKWGARYSYDLMINTSKAGIDGSVKIIKTYLEECRNEDILPD